MHFIQAVLLVGTVTFGVSVYLYTAALHEARFKFPLPFQDEEAARHAMDTFVWNRPISTATRRKYLLSMACAAVAAACTALGMSIHGSLFGAVCFGGIAVIGASAATARWIKHRDRL
jgi:hypothetical protein